MKYSVIANSTQYYGQVQQLVKNYLTTVEQHYPSIAVIIRKPLLSELQQHGSVVIGDHGEPIAWLRAKKVPDAIFGDTVDINMGDYAFDHQRFSASALKTLYGQESVVKTQGVLKHAVYCPAFDQRLLWTWFELGFGIEQVYASANLKDIHDSVKSNRQIRIEALNQDNHEAFISFHDLIATDQAQAPTWAGAPISYLDDLKSGFTSLLHDLNAITFVAFIGHQAIGYQTWYAENNAIVELAVSGTSPAFRGQGVATALTAHIAAELIRQGYQYGITDWRTANPLAASFWPSIGFVPYRYRLVRRFTPDLLADGERPGNNG